MDRPATDTDLVAAAQDGDVQAFGDLVERYQTVAFRAAYLLVRDAQAAEDVAQEGFIRAHRNVHRFRPGDPFRPWLLRIVTNLALNELRRRKRQRGLFSRLASREEPSVPGPAQATELTERQHEVWDAIAHLKGDDQMVLYLRHFLGLSEEEMASAIGRPRGTVKSRLSRASARLREVIERDHPALRRRGEEGCHGA